MIKLALALLAIPLSAATITLNTLMPITNHPGGGGDVHTLSSFEDHNANIDLDAGLQPVGAITWSVTLPRVHPDVWIGYIFAWKMSIQINSGSILILPVYISTIPMASMDFMGRVISPTPYGSVIMWLDCFCVEPKTSPYIKQAETVVTIDGAEYHLALRLGSGDGRVFATGLPQQVLSLEIPLTMSLTSLEPIVSQANEQAPAHAPEPGMALLVAFGVFVVLWRFRNGHS